MTWSRLQAGSKRDPDLAWVSRVVVGLLVLLLWSGFPVGASDEQAPSPAARSVILMIGDGMGAEHVKAARWFSVGTSGALAMDQLEVQDGWARTADVNGSVTDSAAAATALATGFKTQNARLSVDVAGRQLRTILEMAKADGKAVGLITTVPLTHATPAAFAVHVDSRYKNTEIALQLFEADVDVLMGGGAHDFLPYRVLCECGWSGERTDGRNLLSDAHALGYTFVCDDEGLSGVHGQTTDRVFGLFADEQMLNPLSPTLADMVDLAIEILSRDPDGFFLMVEGGQIDWAAHDNEAEEVMEYTLGFDQAVSGALEYVRQVGDALLIVTSDHETGGMTLAVEQKGRYREDGPFSMPNSDTFYVNWTGTDHTGVDVPVRAEGPLAEWLSGTYENTYIFDVMVLALGLGETAAADQSGE